MADQLNWLLSADNPTEFGADIAPTNDMDFTDISDIDGKNNLYKFHTDWTIIFGKITACCCVRYCSNPNLQKSFDRQFLTIIYSNKRIFFVVKK